MKLYEVRHQSEMLGTHALFDTYTTIEKAREAAQAFKARCFDMGLMRLMKSIEVI